MKKKKGDGETIKKNPKYECEKCNYITFDKWKFERHLSTDKHLSPFSASFLKKNIPKKGKTIYHCVDCQKTYKTAKPFLNHKKQHEIQNNILHNLLKKQEEQDKKLEKCIEMLSNKESVTNNNLTIQVFLNENCKNAISLDEFIDNLKVNITDLLNTKQVGYVDGITNILIKNLNTLKFEERPIHCSNTKKQLFHVKINEEWNDDDGNEVSKIIKAANKAQIYVLSEWLQSHPNWASNEIETEEYMKLIQSLTKIEDIDKSKKILHNIANAVLIQK